MADMSLKIKADQLGKSLENLAPKVEEEINMAVKNLAQAAYASMINQIQSSKMDPKNRQDYLNGLKYQDLGNDQYLIHLEGEWANKLESGFGSYSIRDLLLKSTKTVAVGSRAGKPWVQTNKEGGKYAHVPFEHKLNAPPSLTGDLATDIKQMTAMNRSTGQEQPLQKIFKDIDGNPIAGKVATISDAINPKFQNLTKYQYVSPKGAVSSVYMTYRTVSENGKDWVHPGYSGKLLFKEVEQFVDQELENIIKTLLK